MVAWIERMLAPKAEGPFEPWAALEPTLLPLLRDEVAGCFLPWSEANARALAEGRDVELALGGRPFRQQPQKYHARSLAALRARYAAARSDRARRGARARELPGRAPRRGVKSAGPGARAPGPALGAPSARYFVWMWIVRGFASSRLGTRSVSTPSLKLASTFSGFAFCGSANERLKLPKLRST